MEKYRINNALQMQHASQMKTAAVHSRIQPEIKQQAEDILLRLGLSPTEAIRMFYTQITLRNGLPFALFTKLTVDDSRKFENDWT